MLDTQVNAESNTPSYKVSISIESWILGAICAADMISTILLVRSGRAIEANPVLSFFMDRAGLLGFAVAKSLLFVAPLFALELLRTRRPQFVRKMMRLGIAAYLVGYGVGVAHLNQNNHPQVEQIASRANMP